MVTTAAVIGGGIGGLATAIALSKAGLQVDIYEQAPELAEIGAGLSLWANATRALTELGLGEELTKSITPLEALESRVPHGQVLHHSELGPIHRKLGYASATMHRGELLRILLSGAAQTNLYTSNGLQSLAMGARSGPVLQLEGGRRVPANLVVGADGLFSTVRRELQPDAIPRYAGYATWRGVAEIDPPPEWPSMTLVRTVGRGEYFGIGEISPGRYLWYATKNRSLDEAEPGGRKATVLRHFGKWHRPVSDLIEATAEESILLHPVFRMSPLKRWTNGRVVLVGDAAHPIEPSLGMGACLAIEDAVVLAACLTREAVIEDGLALYERVRRPRAMRIVRWSQMLARSEQVTNAVICFARDLGTRLSPPALTRILASRAFDFNIP
jgi:2-polyprenyl-6-methoxyphenol hydroxylase-like FAD-dependent oxidoreductase